MFSFFNLRFLVEFLYNKYITRLTLRLGGQTTRVLDKGLIELVGPYGLEKGLLNLSKNLSSLDTGVVTSYALYILIGLISYMLIPYISMKDTSITLLIVYTLYITNMHISASSFSPYEPQNPQHTLLKSELSVVSCGYYLINAVYSLDSESSFTLNTPYVIETLN